MIPEHIRRLVVHNTVFRRPQTHHIINCGLVDGIFFLCFVQVCQEAQGILPCLLVQDREEGVLEDRRGDGSRRGGDDTGWRWTDVSAATMVVVRERTWIHGDGQILRRGG